ncbi:SDR family NAD(P)-dependent oxidoreductase [Danxiaibacter flavus]|uniref:SDR family NAD(P)-dependent oxidoreductase n=1 Tax=Danxiaibacter flavus TaxID=3049108 RepID=A0ABV3Z960_9BACT|nr:SDR family NAD(P)-dependent oxidoreductase [Chitinophagaceae bacterium DXS]
MARIFITGSPDGLGQMAARNLIKEGHQVVLHARNEKRIHDALAALPGAETAIAADLSSVKETIQLAEKINSLGAFDAIIHNAAMGYREPKRKVTVDGLPDVFAVNSMAPYLLTALINKPKRLIYLSSGLHTQGDTSLQDITWEKRHWNGFQAYSDSKLHDLILSQAVARLWPDVYSNAVEPGWVATKMGGQSAPDNLEEGAITQCWLAVSSDSNALVTGNYFYHQRMKNFLAAAADMQVQDRFFELCAALSGVHLK